ncbi:GNAT family N-acetyltransferase [uncultured Pontibacter sp.]|uniref:GNAT family N-acetyltransferase n=1 Tax=uncultured Pontibacter sp. TaxID=453356 RepID=UPI00260FD832|nr:GNAT family N-acetyltransferase [uncultured Pontibacter sp.]
MIEVVKYTLAYKAVWDAFVAGAKNATFLFCRDYMEYHADRFVDHSLLFYSKNELIAMLPACEQGAAISSHSGLTYGGVISCPSMKTERMLQVFQAMIAYCQQHGFTSIRYKTVPHIYHQVPAEEDLYALFKSGGRLYRRDVLSVIEQANPVKYSKTRRWEVKKAHEQGWSLGRSQKFEAFMQLEAQLLKEKYDTSPVHTWQEMLYLVKLFPDNIKLYTAEKSGELSAGVIIYETAKVAHCQYIASTEEGRRQGAIPALLNYLITHAYASKKFFDFGTSSDTLYESGLNGTLLANKESYGARAVVHDFYTLDI